MAKIILITGGARSGKSEYAEQYALNITDNWYYLATCQAAQDQEMQTRIAKHKQRRQGRGWHNIEEDLELCHSLTTIPHPASVLIDCLTMWISNMLLAADGNLTEEQIKSKCHDLIRTCREGKGTYIMVSGEVGGGIVPENNLARRYRDLVGRCNQIIAAAANEVFLVSCGIPQKIK